MMSNLLASMAKAPLSLQKVHSEKLSGEKHVFQTKKKDENTRLESLYQAKHNLTHVMLQKFETWDTIERSQNRGRH